MADDLLCSVEICSIPYCIFGFFLSFKNLIDKFDVILDMRDIEVNIYYENCLTYLQSFYFK